MICGIYLYSKAWEFLDIIFVSLMGIQPNLHFIVHHTTTPCLAWLVWTYSSTSGTVFLLASVFMHIFLHAYCGGAKSNFVFQCTSICGHVQLVIGILGSTLALRQKLPQSSNSLDGCLLCVEGPGDRSFCICLAVPQEGRWQAGRRSGWRTEARTALRPQASCSSSTSTLLHPFGVCSGMVLSILRIPLNWEEALEVVLRPETEDVVNDIS